MSIEHWCNDAAKGLAGVAYALALFLTGCGGSGRDVACGDLVCDAAETADGCPVDCGCGNNVANPGEQCDGPDLGGGTCMDAVQRGGTLRCNADCTYDVTECTLASCGNGIVEEGEACDGADLGGGTCSSIGYAGGDLSCSADCAYDVAACCSDTCPTEGKSECVGDSVRACTRGASGCLAWEITDCAADNNICESDGTTAVCSCVDRCSTVGETRCEGPTIETCVDVGGCFDWQQSMTCGTGKTCADASAGPTCVLNISAEDCTDAYPLSLGENVIAWTAINADYLIDEPSCSTLSLDGPDLVMSYTPAESGFVTFTMNKPSGARHDIVVSDAACGNVRPELACASELSGTTLSTEVPVTMGTTYYFYVRDTTSGADPLDHPLIVNLEEQSCSSLEFTTTTLSPSNGVSLPNRTPVMSADFNYPIDPSAGVITLTGDMGTNLTYDLSTTPDEIAVLNDGMTLLIDPGIQFPDGETLTVSWSGLYDATCGELIDPPAWSFQVTNPPCTPGMNGMVGDSITRVPTGLSSFTEYYVAVDDQPDGYVYIGGTSDLYRAPKAGGIPQDVTLLAGLSADHLGYDMLVDGDQIFTLESVTGETTGLLWRISADGGTTWSKQDYMTLPQAPNDDMRGITSYKGRYYITTSESSAGTEIWSVPASATILPQQAVLEATIPDEDYCSGIALDDKYYYLACYNADRIIRVDRVTLAKEFITDAYYINSTKVSLRAHDFDGNGLADALYFSGYYEEVDYVCSPAGTAPFYTGVLAAFGSGSSNYGLAFDQANNTLWMLDDDTRELIKIE